MRMLSRALLLSCITSAVVAKDTIFYTGCSASVVGCEGTELCCPSGSLDDATGICTFYDNTQCYTCGKQDGMKECKCEAPSGATGQLTCKTDVMATGSGVGSSLPATTPNSGVTMTLGTYNGMKGWNDISPSRFYDFTEFLVGLVATIPSFYTREGFNVVYDCNAAGLLVVPPDFKGCNIFLFSYRCPPCDSRSGSLGSYLLSYDEDDVKWYVGNCGPMFKLNYQLGVKHQFAVYSAEMTEGRVTVTLPDDVQFMFWALVGKSIVCQSMDTKAQCDKFPINCQWTDEGVCRPAACPIPYGLWAGAAYSRCEICVDDEEDFIPEVKGI